MKNKKLETLITKLENDLIEAFDNENYLNEYKEALIKSIKNLWEIKLMKEKYEK